MVILAPSPVVLQDYPLEPVEGPVTRLLRSGYEWLAESPNHWQRGSYGSRADGRTCAVGAIKPLGVWFAEITDAVTYLTRQIPLTSGRRGFGLPGYNDDLKTSYEDILALYERAINWAWAEGA